MHDYVEPGSWKEKETPPDSEILQPAFVVAEALEPGSAFVPGSCTHDMGRIVPQFEERAGAEVATAVGYETWPMFLADYPPIVVWDLGQKLQSMNQNHHWR